MVTGIGRTRGARQGGRVERRRWPVALVGALAVTLLWGCEGKSSRMTGPSVDTGSARPAPAVGARRVSAELRDRSLFDHNAGHFGGRTFRWVGPVPIHVTTGNMPALDDFLLQQFAAWETVLAGVVPGPLYEVRPMARQLPARGIFFTITDLPEPFLAVGDPISPLAQRRRGETRALRLLQQPLPAGAPRRLEIPEIRGDGQIQRCVIAFDRTIETLDDATFARLVRHEIGHCLGFLNHVSSGVMTANVDDPRASLTISADVAKVMRTLYGLPPGTTVTR